jgi:hypothetical protein
MDAKGYTKMRKYRSVESKIRDVMEKKDPREYGYEGDMAMTQLRTIIRNSQDMHDMMKPDTDLPEWVQSKITLATDYIQTAADYMKSELSEAAKHMAPGGGPETDMNDQIAVGSYQTKSFEMSNPAQKLYAHLSKDVDVNGAEQAAIHLDKLFDLEKDVVVRKHASSADLTAAKKHAENVKHLADKIGLSKEHEFVDTHVNNIAKHVKDEKKHLAPHEFVSPDQNPKYQTPAKDYTTDRTSDRDVDNTKMFRISRGLKAQRKLKIIDND